METSGKNLITKKALVESLKSLMKEKNFSSITVSDITNGCGLSRLTFYYHFQDKYDLLNWMCQLEVVEPFEKGVTLSNWDEKFFEALTFMKKNQYYYSKILTNNDSELQHYIFKVTADILKRGLNELGKGVVIPATDNNFIAFFFADGVIGALNRWANSGMKETPKYVASQMKNLVEDSKALILSRYLGNN